LLEDPLAQSVARLRGEDGGNLLVVGSTELAAALLTHDLVDELRLMIDPVILGGGKRFFRDDGACWRLALASSEATPTGAMLATYVRSGPEAPAAAGAPSLPRPPRAARR
jgi:dihydrofolate reductase